MSFSQPDKQIPRWSVRGMEGMWTKMWDPPTESPATPEFITPTNPVPEVMAAAGLADLPTTPHTLELDLLHGLTLDTWDGLKRLAFYTVSNADVPLAANGTYPGTTIRMPRGCIYHATTHGQGPPPHTIHWHGFEPTPMNDGVGHCSMEIGEYTYQMQPSFIGTYFYHCHRNTMQHFEFGLYGLLLVEPPDAYFATQHDPDIPIGHCRDGKRRTAANLTNFPQFPNFVGGDIRDPDPEANNQNLPASLKFLSNPHAMTVAYDVEALWVIDDRDSNWSDLAPDARATFPRQGNTPGYDDEFGRNPGSNGFFAFNDYRADYWFVTGVAVPAAAGGVGTIPEGIVVPAALNSGISGSQVSVEAFTNQTILIRALDAAYNNCVYTFPFDIVIIAWDGRALGIAPYGFNEAYEVPANTPITVSVGRRFDALARFTTPGKHLVKCKMIDTRGANTDFERVTITINIPVNISQAPGQFAITAAAAANGAISPAGVTNIAGGGSQTYTITPNPGFTVSALVVDGQQQAGATSHTFSNVTASHYINAYFAASPNKITAAAGANGTISPAGQTPVTPGSNQAYTITPNAGYVVSALVVDGQVLAGATSHTFSNVTASHSINAYFAPSPHKIRAGAGANGTISPAGQTPVTPGSSQTYTITPNPGYIVSALVVDGQQQAGATSHTFSNVTASHYINAYFAPSPHKITAGAGANGSISPAGQTPVTPGSSQTYTITPNPGYRVSALVVDGQALAGATSHTFSNVTASHYINAYFELL